MSNRSGDYVIAFSTAAECRRKRSALRDFLARFDYLHNSSCGIIYHLAAYWKARRSDVIGSKP